MGDQAKPSSTEREQESINMVTSVILANPKLQDEVTSYRHAVQDFERERPKEGTKENSLLLNKIKSSKANLTDGAALELPAIKDEYVAKAIDKIGQEASAQARVMSAVKDVQQQSVLVPPSLPPMSAPRIPRTTTHGV